MTKIFCHHDADGLISAYMTSYGVKSPEIIIADKFGDTKDWEDGSYMVDMRPIDPKIEGTVIDHHPGHPPLTERTYSLTWETRPASILCWKKFKDKIPKKEWWKVMIGAVGDGQPEKVPFEIWDACPELMQKHKTFIKFSYGEWKTSYRPAYQLMSSGINAFARYGEFDTALRLIKDAKAPADIINNPEISAQKSKLSNTTSGDFAKIMQNAEIYPMKNLTLCIYNSPNVRVSGYVASVLQSSKENICVLAINEDNGSLSLRGDTANYIKGKLNDLDYINIDGHDGFCFDKETKVLTEDGWKFFKDVTKEDKIFSRDPETNKIELLKPTKLISYRYKGKMIHFNGDRTIDLKVTPDHDMPYISEWNYRKNGKRSLSFKKATEVRKFERLPVGGGKWIGNDNENITVGNKDYDTNLLSKFIGWYMSEGWTTKKGNSYRINIAQSKKTNLEKCNDIENVLDGLEFKYSYNELKNTYTFTESNIGKILYEMAGHKSTDKKIPKIFKNLSPRYLNQILNSFRKGDGFKRGNEIVYFTSSKQLVSDLCELIVKCNRRPSIKCRNDKGNKFSINGKNYETKSNGYIIRDCKNTYSIMSRKSKKEVEYNDMVYDVTLPKYHTLFVERNGKTIWSANCGGHIDKHPRYLYKELLEIL